MNDQRTTDFLRPESSAIPGVKLRPLTSGSYALLVRTKNAFVQPAGAETPDHLTAALEYAFIHGAPLDVVLRAAHSAPETFHTEVFRFSEAIPIGQLHAIIREVEGGLVASAAQSVDVLPRPGSEDKDAPPNS